MAEIDSLGNSFYYAGLQNSSSQLKNQKADKAQKTSKSKFTDFLKTDKAEENLQTNGLPAEIQTMSVEEAVVFLRDRVDLAGNDLSESSTQENLKKFKEAVGQFIKFIVDNNFEVSSKKNRRPQFVSPVGFFSNYNTKPRLKDPKVQINVINEKLDDLTRDMLSNQTSNLKILAQINEIKGLVIDLLSD